ncbi:MAG: A/G-specific adenine glycosylase [Planctomycetota bacterium]
MTPSRRRLLSWYRRNRRDFPWRRTTDPYAIWVSEIMAQQTRVGVVVAYYERFLKRFPDVRTLARARLQTVLGHWSGLGYYRRARHLHASAKILAREGFPETEAGWRALPGVGAYTAAAIASIAFGRRAAVVDGNVERVLCRLHRLKRDPRRVRELADAWISPSSPGDHNQAVMELGATLCTPRAPRCRECPLVADCLGRAAPERYPGPKPRPATVRERRAVAFVRRDGRVLLRQLDGRRLDGLWDLPETAPKGEVLGRVRHSILDRRLEITIHRGRAGRTRAGAGWFGPRRASALALTASARKCLRAVGFLDESVG